MANAGNLFVTVGAKIKDFEKKMNTVSKKLKNVGDSMKNTGEKLTTSLSVPMAAFGGVAVQSASEWQSAQARIQATTGKTAQEAEKLTQIAKDLWLNAYGENAIEAAEAVALVDRNMQGLSDADLSTITEQAFIIRDAFGAEIPDTVRTASVMMENFGITGQEAMDLITVGFQQGGDYAGDLLDTLWEYSPQFAKMGIDAQTALNMLIAGAKSGAFNMDKMGDAVKEFSVRAVDGSKTTAEGFEMIGLNADEMAQKIAQGGESAQQAFQATLLAISQIEDPVKRNQAGVALFGTMWEDLGEKAVSSMLGAEDQLGQVEGSTKKAGEALQDNFGTKLQETWRNAKAALEPLGLVLIDLANAILPVLTVAIQNVSTWFSNLSPTTQRFIAILGLLVAALGPVLVILGTTVGAIGNLIPVVTKVFSWLTKLTPVIKGVGVALRFLALNPVGLAITAIAGLIAIGISVWKNWDSIKPKLIAVWETVRDALGKSWDWIKSKAKWLGDTLSNIWTNIKTWVIDRVTGMVSTVVDKFSSFVSNVRNKFNQAKERILNPIETARDKIKDIVDKIKGFFDRLKLKIPKPKLPKLPRFSISGKFSLNPPSIPKISVDWFAKGGIVDGARLIGVGEAGPEAIVPLRGQAMQPFADAIAEKIAASNMSNREPAGEIVVPVILEGREIARVTAPYMDRELRRRQNASARARGGM